jgi:oxygen-independent coproporphyrinogen-3 oxidase
VHCYLHIPFCAGRCHYCDFGSVIAAPEIHERYVDALLSEVRTLPPGPWQTIHIGGGTPTCLAPKLLERLLGGLHAILRPNNNTEWSVEGNPAELTEERLGLLRNHGVNRLSIGVQSMDDERLRFLGRRHNSEQADIAVRLARKYFPRLSVDFILDLPGQSPAKLQQDLIWTKRWNVDHVSAYALSVEEGTPLAKLVDTGACQTNPAEHTALLLETAWDQLAEIGFFQYETSNFAKSGQESQHNLAYWRCKEYHAAGANAVSRVGRQRIRRHPDPKTYIAAITSGESVEAEREELSPTDLQREAWMLGLRISEGVRLSLLHDLGDPVQRWHEKAKALQETGMIIQTETAIALTRQGRLLQDAITVELMP